MEGLYVENKTSKPNTCGGEPQRATRVVKQVHGLLPPVSEKPGISHLGQALKTDGDERNRQGPGTAGSEGLGLRPGAPGTAASLARSSPLEPPFPKTPGVGLLPGHASPCLGEYMWGGVWPLFQRIRSENRGYKAITPCQRPQQTRQGGRWAPARGKEGLPSEGVLLTDLAPPPRPLRFPAGQSSSFLLSPPVFS